MSFPQHIFSRSRKGWMVVCLLLSFLSLGGAVQPLSDEHTQVKTEQTYTPTKQSHTTRRNIRYPHALFLPSRLFNHFISCIRWQQKSVFVQYKTMQKAVTGFSLVIENIIAASLYPAANYLPASIA